METARLLSKGRVTLPKTVRDANRWQPGTQFVVEDLPNGVLLRPLKPFASSRLEGVAGCLRYPGKAKSLAQIDAEVKKRHAQGRY